MKNKILITTMAVIFITMQNCMYSQSNNSTKELIYTIEVDGLISRDQAARLDNSLKHKAGIISDEINFEAKTIVIKTIADITYSNLCDVLFTEKIKAQNYIVKESK